MILTILRFSVRKIYLSEKDICWIRTIVSGLKNVNLPIRLKTALNDLKKEQNIVITKADKGGKVVILNSNDYCSKLEDILSDHSTYER